ncbi:dTDP-4-dehydrorhamnose 3,5-epimerase family protein [Clostridium estertheticum]|uniref:dTDP-4-dehydrorhamnose 3,5-epimerase family protein n=1 Tax=Clostridium estertheticum TaxID=238834 RepID=UPI001C7CB196|nr:dTDP-4-dehydrorhamnose 3,5-epimerase family protein [Clostridium estertheticum]MBX4258425.1 dTDP-4-dehydrorhamnose 3,5-epimerase family protein [Clostridium estertheticum]WLC69620.1 dTDP-4-dehydrorhamnose 3,5-epimerase family protein [Clostridium estertheticum]
MDSRIESNLDKLTYAWNLENPKLVENNINYKFVQANICDSGTVEKIFKKYLQGKLVGVIYGEVFDVALDVALDLRKGSKTYERRTGDILSDENKKQFYVLERFVHEFLVFTEKAKFFYKDIQVH